MIIPAKDLKVKITREDIIDCFCDNLMERIKKKAEEGVHTTVFDASVWYYEPTNEIATKPNYEKWTQRDKWNANKYNFSDYKDEIKERFIAAGYKIKPTGYIGGVWQDSEDIMW